MKAEDWLNKNCDPKDFDELTEGVKDYIHASDVFRYMEEFSERNNWINVEDELPKSKETGFIGVIVYRPSNNNVRKVFQGVYNRRTNNFQTLSFDVLLGVTHWMPLPEPPKQ